MEPGTEGFCTIEEALEELRQGRMIVLVDDENRENEGDLVIAAEKVTPEAINFMMRNACGMVCLAMSPAICDRLNLDIDARRQRRSVRPRRSRSRSTPAPASPPASRPSTAPAPSQVAIDDALHARRPGARQRPRATACAPARAASWSAPATPRAASTWPGWPA